MLEACVRRACLSASGEVDTKLHQHVRDQTRVWCSDGADLQVPMTASGSFSWARVPRLGRGALGPDTLRQLYE